MPDGLSENGATSNETPVDLKQQIEQLRSQLAKANFDAETYRRAAYAMLERLEPYVRPSEEELHDMMHGPRGRPILDIVTELEQGLANERGSADGRG